MTVSTKKCLKRKNGKKESKRLVEQLIQSAISPEGGARVNAAHYAHDVLGHYYLSCPFSPFRMKTRFEINL